MCEQLINRNSHQLIYVHFRRNKSSQLPGFPCPSSPISAFQYMEAFSIDASIGRGRRWKYGSTKAGWRVGDSNITGYVQRRFCRSGKCQGRSAAKRHRHDEVARVEPCGNINDGNRYHGHNHRWMSFRRDWDYHDRNRNHDGRRRHNDNDRYHRDDGGAACGNRGSKYRVRYFHKYDDCPSSSARAAWSITTTIKASWISYYTTARSKPSLRAAVSRLLIKTSS